MLTFCASDPFPLPDAANTDYRGWAEHSQAVDSWLGLSIREVEERISSRLAGGMVSDGGTRPHQAWVGLAPETLQTPYVELRRILHEISPRDGSIVVDLGAAYGRLGHVMGRHFPKAMFLGYELVEERVVAGRAALRAHGLYEDGLQCADLSCPEFRLREADFYFIYDFGTREAIGKTLEDLRSIARRRAITVVGRGRASRDAIERQHPWLSQVVEPRHFPRWSLYRSG